MPTNLSVFIPDLWANEQRKANQSNAAMYKCLYATWPKPKPLTAKQKIENKRRDKLRAQLNKIDSRIHATALKNGIDLDTEYPHEDD